jgi:hypothetical protein
MKQTTFASAARDKKGKVCHLFGIKAPGFFGI